VSTATAEQTRRDRERDRERFTGRMVSDLSEDEIEAAGTAGYDLDGGSPPGGRDPRTMKPAELRAMGHQPMPPMSVIRLKCLDCCAGSPVEVAKCAALACPSWPFRTGKNPWREISEGRREAGRRLAAKRVGKLSDTKSDLDETAGTPLPGTPGPRA
jgi:hypothetical protein